MEIVATEIEDYLQGLVGSRHEVQVAMEKLAAERDFPIVGPCVGALLETLARSIQAERVLELGSRFGYSAFWFAHGMRKGSEIIHTDLDADNRAQAQKFLADAGFAERVTYAEGEALEVLRAEEGPFDIIFCDIDKIDYPKVPELALSKLRSGGMLIFDNMLWSGRVLDKEQDEDTQAIAKLTSDLFSRSNLTNTLLPLRDGVLVSLKN